MTPDPILGGAETIMPLVSDECSAWGAEGVVDQLLAGLFPSHPLKVFDRELGVELGPGPLGQIGGALGVDVHRRRVPRADRIDLAEPPVELLGQLAPAVLAMGDVEPGEEGCPGDERAGERAEESPRMEEK